MYFSFSYELPAVSYVEIVSEGFGTEWLYKTFSNIRRGMREKKLKYKTFQTG